MLVFSCKLYNIPQGHTNPAVTQCRHTLGKQADRITCIQRKILDSCTVCVSLMS